MPSQGGHIFAIFLIQGKKKANLKSFKIVHLSGDGIFVLRLLL